MPHLLLTDFSGGWNTNSEYRLGVSESPFLSGFFGERGVLRSVEGIKQIEGPGTEGVYGCYRYHGSSSRLNNGADASQSAWTIAKSGSALWMDIAPAEQTPDTQWIAELQAADNSEHPPLSLRTASVPRLARVTVTIKNAASETASGNAVTYAIVGKGTGGESLTDSVTFSADDLADVPPGESVTKLGSRWFSIAAGDNPITSCTPSAAQPTDWKHSCGAEETVDWRPVAYPRQPGKVERFCPYGGRLYATNDVDPALAFEGVAYWLGTVSTTSGSTTVTGSGTRWQCENVAPGDLIFFKHTGTNAVWDVTNVRYVIQVSSDTSLKISSAPACGTKSGIDYMIARSRPMGMQWPDHALTGEELSGGQMAQGYYKYLYTYGNAYSGYESDPVRDADGSLLSLTAQIVGSGGRSFTLTLPDHARTPIGPDSAVIWAADRLHIYRTAVAPSEEAIVPIYYRVTTLQRAGENFEFPGAYTDTEDDFAIEGRQVMRLPYHHDMPPQLCRLWEFNKRLYGIRASDPHILRLSNLNDVEYWPQYDFSLAAPDNFKSSNGSFARAGEGPSDPVLAVVGEGGAYGALGRAGSNVLVFTKSRAVRWFGWDWTDFRMEPAIAMGCWAAESVQNCEGITVWLAREGLMTLEPGSNFPARLDDKIRGLQNDPTYFRNPYRLRNAVAASWKDWYVISWPTGAEDFNSETIYVHLPSKTFWPLKHYQSPMQADGFMIMNGPNDDGELVYWSRRSRHMYGARLPTPTEDGWGTGWGEEEDTEIPGLFFEDDLEGWTKAGSSYPSPFDYSSGAIHGSLCGAFLRENEQTEPRGISWLRYPGHYFPTAGTIGFYLKRYAQLEEVPILYGTGCVMTNWLYWQDPPPGGLDGILTVRIAEPDGSRLCVELIAGSRDVVYGGVVADVDWTPHVWRHVAISYGKGPLRVWIDGEERDLPRTGCLELSGLDMFFGHPIDPETDISFGFLGWIDWIRASPIEADPEITGTGV